MPVVVINRPIKSGTSDLYKFSMEELGTWGRVMSREYDLGTYLVAKHIYILNDKSNIKDVDDFFDTMIGRYGELWFPSWREDMRLNGVINASSTLMTIVDTNYMNDYFDNSRGTRIFVFLKTGTWFIRTITSASSNTSITISSSFGQTISPDDVALISFLYPGRFEIDAIEWVYDSGTVAKTQLSFRELSYKYALLPAGVGISGEIEL